MWQTYLLQKYLIINPDSVFYIDLAMENMAEVNAYIVFIHYLNIG